MARSRKIAIAFLILVFIAPTSIFSQIESGFVQIKGGQIYYRIWGEGDPIVFLNGGPGFASQGYESYAEVLSKNYKVVLFDQRGTGKSTLKDRSNISITKMVYDLEDLRIHLGIEKWVVFGHSFGGVYALHYASKFGSKINKLILSASPSYKSNPKNAFQKFKNVNKEDIIPFLELDNFKVLKAELEKEVVTSETRAKMNRCVRAKYYVSNPENSLIVADWFANKVIVSDYVNKKVWDTLEYTSVRKKKLKKFTSPVLILHGISDFVNISNPIANHEFFSNSTFEIIYDSGHIMSIDRREKYFGLITEFLEE